MADSRERVLKMERQMYEVQQAMDKLDEMMYDLRAESGVCATGAEDYEIRELVQEVMKWGMGDLLAGTLEKLDEFSSMSWIRRRSD